MANHLAPGIAALIASVGLSSPAAPRANLPSTPQPVFRTETALVRITATVTTAAGRPITSLQQQDFAVAEDNVPQDIALFTRDTDTPLSVAMVLDVSGSMKEELDTVRAGLREFLAQVRPDDEVGLVTFSSRTRRLAALDASRADLLAALDGVRGRGGTALYEGIVEGVRLLAGGRHRKKVLLLVTDGNRTGHRASRRSATRAVQRSETLVYALGIGHSGRESLVGRIIAAVNGPQMGLLRALAGDSGGRAELVDDLNGAGRPQIVDTIRAFGEELRQQYTIGYYPPAHRGDKTVHRIRVTTRQPDQLVRARTVYVATP